MNLGRPRNYILDPEIGEGRVPIEVDLQTWINHPSTNDQRLRRVGHTTIGTVWVSTVFLGIDYQYGEGKPMLFETMAFDDSDKKRVQLSDESPVRFISQEVDGVFGRWSTWEDAELGHCEMVAKLRDMMGLPKEEDVARLLGRGT